MTENADSPDGFRDDDLTAPSTTLDRPFGNFKPIRGVESLLSYIPIQELFTEFDGTDVSGDTGFRAVINPGTGEVTGFHNFSNLGSEPFDNLIPNLAKPPQHVRINIPPDNLNEPPILGFPKSNLFEGLQGWGVQFGPRLAWINDETLKNMLDAMATDVQTRYQDWGKSHTNTEFRKWLGEQRLKEFNATS